MNPLHAAGAILCVAIWGVSIAVVKFGLDQLPPMLMMAFRFAIVAPILLLFPIPRAELGRIARLSVPLGALHFAFMFTGVAKLDAATAVIAAQAQVPFTAILAAILLKDAPGWRRIVGMALAFAGVVVAVGRPGALVAWDGVAYVLTGALLFAYSTVRMKGLSALHPYQFWGWISLFAAPQLLVLSLLLEEGHWAAVTGADWRAWAAVAHMAAVVTWVGHGLWFWLLRRESISFLNSFVLLNVPIGVAASALLRGETLDWTLGLGGAMTLAGVAVILIRRPEVGQGAPRP